jgi:hypothetical protein
MQDKTIDVLRPRSSPQRRGLCFLPPETPCRKPTQQENIMAKGQMRGNREAKKPKQVKKPAEAAPSDSLTKGMLYAGGGKGNKAKK